MVITVHLVAFILTPSISGITPVRGCYDEYKIALQFKFLLIISIILNFNIQIECTDTLFPIFSFSCRFFLFNVSRLRIPLARLLERSTWFLVIQTVDCRYAGKAAESITDDQT